jgi:hypothetical protein
MVVYMKFWDNKLGAAKVIFADLHERWELRHAFREVPRPRATNVV